MDHRNQYFSDNNLMKSLSPQGYAEFLSNLQDHDDRVMNHMRNLWSRLIEYFKYEALSDTNKELSSLEIQYIEDFTSTDIFYLPFRGRISPDWLKWRKFVHIGEWACKGRNADVIYTKYALYYPRKLLYSSPVHTIHKPPYKINNGPHPCDTTKQTISNQKLW